MSITSDLNKEALRVFGKDYYLRSARRQKPGEVIVGNATREIRVFDKSLDEARLFLHDCLKGLKGLDGS